MTNSVQPQKSAMTVNSGILGRDGARRTCTDSIAYILGKRELDPSPINGKANPDINGTPHIIVSSRHIASLSKGATDAIKLEPPVRLSILLKGLNAFFGGRFRGCHGVEGTCPVFLSQP